MADVFRQASVTRFDRKRDGANLGFVAQSFVLLALAVTPLNKQNDVCANPVVKRPAVRFDHQPQNLLLKLPNVLPVARQTDWQNPSKKRAYLPDVSQNQILGVFSSVPAVAPFTQTDWPNPHRAKRVVVAKHVRGSFNPIGAVIPTAPPFNQLEWPNPQRLRNLQAAQELIITAYLPGDAPFAQIDWPSPAKRKSFVPDWAPNLLESTLSTPPPVLPFNETEWPNPIKRKYVVTFDAPNLIGTTLISAAPAPAPFAQLDWPVQSRKRSMQYGDAQNLLSTTLALQSIPFAQLQWPNPMRRAKVALDGLQSSPIVLSLQQTVESVDCRLVFEAVNEVSIFSMTLEPSIFSLERKQ